MGGGNHQQKGRGIRSDGSLYATNIAGINADNAGMTVKVLFCVTGTK